MNSSNSFYWVIGVLGIAGALFFFWAGLKARREANRLSESGKYGDGKIISRKETGTHRDRTFYVTFEYTAVAADGSTSTRTQEQEVKASHYNDLKEGTSVSVVYLPNANVTSSVTPEARLAGQFEDRSEVVSPFAYGSGCLIGAVLVIGIGLSAVVGQTQQVDVTATYIATASGDLAVVQKALLPRIREWETVKDQSVHTISPGIVGLSGVTQEQIVYGYCSDGTFYVFIPKQFHEGRTSDVHGSNGYGFYSKQDDLCWPSGWITANEGDLGNGWFLSAIVKFDDTATPSPKISATAQGKM